MGIINRYVLRVIVTPALLAAIVVAIVGVAGDLQWRIRELPVAQLTLGDVTRLGAFLLPAIVAYIVPATYLLGILMAFGRLAQNNELVAMKAAGVPLKHIVMPVIVLGGVLSAACFAVQDRVEPWAISRVYDILYTDLPLRVSLNVLPTGIMQEFAGWRVYIGNRNARTATLENLVILKPEEDRRATAYYAESATLLQENGENMLEMRNVEIVPSGESGRMTRMQTDSARLVIPKMQSKVPHTARPDYSLADLRAREHDLAEQVAGTGSVPLKTELAKVRRKIADRLSLPFACLAVTFAAAPLGARSKRSGKSYAFAVGFGIILIYYVLQMAMAPRYLCSLEAGVLRAWVPNLLLSALGIGLLWRVDRV